VAVSTGRVAARQWRNLPIALALIAPAGVLLGVFSVYPMVRAMILGQERGWDQYVDVLRSEEFQHALGVTVKFALLTVPAGVVLGVAMAVLADRYLRGLGFFRAVFSSTVATSVAVASLTWLFLFQPSLGVLSNLDWIGDTFPVVKVPGLLNDPGTALTSVAVSKVWANLGFTFIVVTAGLQSIPRDLHEAATMDGAGNIRRFWSVSLPLLTPTLLFVVVVLTTRAFEAYGEVDLLTDGGPRPDESTTVITYLIYGDRSPITGSETLQATAAVLLFVVLLILAAVQLGGLGRRVHYGN
jgi:sn-glycerol 3-phosphate transport system permease protein